MMVNLIRDPEFARYIGDQRYGEPLQLPCPVDESTKLLVRVVPYGGDRRLMMVRDVTRLHRLEEMRKDVVANVSRELRSLLTVIVGYLETLTDDDEATPENLRRPLKQMAKQADRQYGYSENANELYSAFSNLAFNAVQYTPKDGEIFITWTRTPDGAKLEVRDTGIGIEPHHVPRLTERFFRIDKARSCEIGGTGLGLAIVMHVLVRHDAFLNVQSVPGKGNSFECIFRSSRTSSPETSNMLEHS